MNRRFSSTQLFFQRAVFDRLGGMDETFPIGSDAEVILRWLLSCHDPVLPDVLARRRRWEGSTSASMEATSAMSDTMRALVSSLSSRARQTLSSEQLRVLERGLHASFGSGVGSARLHTSASRRAGNQSSRAARIAREHALGRRTCSRGSPAAQGRRASPAQLENLIRLASSRRLQWARVDSDSRKHDRD